MPAQPLPWWVFVLPLVLVVALVMHDLFLLNWVHVLSGVLWTGADIFLGFILGPAMRRLDSTQRTALITYLVPRQAVYVPVLALTTACGGWFLASWTGLLDPHNPLFAWTIAALVIVTLLFVLGFGVILPNSLRQWRILQQPEPDTHRLVRLNTINTRLTGVEASLQIAIIFVMSRLVVG